MDNKLDFLMNLTGSKNNALSKAVFADLSNLGSPDAVEVDVAVFSSVIVIEGGF